MNRTRHRLVPGQLDVADGDLGLQRRVAHPDRRYTAQRAAYVKIDIVTGIDEPAGDIDTAVVDSLTDLTPTSRLEKRTHAVKQKASLFDNLVGAAEQRERRCPASWRALSGRTNGNGQPHGKGVIIIFRHAVGIQRP